MVSYRDSIISMAAQRVPIHGSNSRLDNKHATFEDGTVSTNQNKKVLWDKIIAKFQENCNGSGQDGGGVYDRWKTINTACTLWKGSLERVMIGMPNGRSATEIDDKVMEIYKTRVTPKNKVFKLQHAWDFLKDCPRLATDVDQQWGRLFQRETAPRNVEDEGVDEMTPSHSLARPRGRDKQKEAKRKGKSQYPMSGHLATGIAKLNKTHNASQEETARMRLQMKEEGDRKQDRFEINFMMEDLNKYTPERKKFLRGKRPRPLIRRTTSMTKIIVDLRDVEGQELTDDLRNTQPHPQPKTNPPCATNNVHAVVVVAAVNDAFSAMGLFPEQKITVALRMLAYGVSADQGDEIARMGKSTILKSLMRFCGAIESIYTAEYLRIPIDMDLQKLLKKGKMRGFPGMIGSINCMHWTWKNCPSAWQGAFGDRK
ncbi:uncharacterized protein [Malus domestica]|uniref:uncharacterized protein n=1 Tax=Malus domestica TaxID=3750 RepID=UPI0039769A54